MSEDLQSLLEKINRDGVEKAEAEAKKIIDAAEKRAAEIVSSAKDEAARAKAEAERESALYAERAAETIRQAARDTVISVRDSVTRLLENLLAKNVDAALADEKNAAALVMEAIRELTGGIEISASAKLAETLKAQLAASGSITVSTADAPAAGFTVKLDGGRIEHDFSAAVIAGEIAKRLRPDLANLVRQ
jgi:V/A-type H+-transporting ATPase subunit E